MKTVMHIIGGVAIGSAATTAMMVVLDQKLLIGPFVLITFTLTGLVAALWYLDRRVRRMLLDLCEQLMELAIEQNRPLIYHDAMLLYDEIKANMALTAAALEIGYLAAPLSMQVDLDPVI